MNGSVPEPLRVGVLGAARITERSLVGPARATGTHSSYTYQLEALAAHLRHGAPLPLDADGAVETMTLIDACYRAAGLPPRPRTTL